MATPLSNISILGICTRMLAHFSKRKMEIDLTWERWFCESSPQDDGLVQPSSCPMRRCCCIFASLSAPSLKQEKKHICSYTSIYPHFKYMRFEMYITQLHTYKYVFIYIYILFVSFKYTKFWETTNVCIIPFIVIHGYSPNGLQLQGLTPWSPFPSAPDILKDPPPETSNFPPKLDPPDGVCVWFFC